MVRFTHDGLELWYGTPDAPAPDGTTEPREGVSVTVGVRPADPASAVRLRYRVDGRAVETLPAPLVATDFSRRTQYFRATFPAFRTGETVEYVPVVSSEGRRAPDPATASTFPTAFGVKATDPVSPGEGPPESTRVSSPAELPQLEHLVHVRVVLAQEAELIGATPAGYVVNWPPESGVLDGPAFRGSVLLGGEHRTVIRPDGIGVLSVSVTVRTSDGALIGLDYSGTVEFGPDWAARLAGGSWPDVLPVRSHIHLLTSAPMYQWLNRVAVLGVGEVRPPERLYTYDMYAVR